MPESQCLLIVEQLPPPAEAHQSLLLSLIREYRLDPYATRQRLFGQGRAGLTSGTAAELAPLSNLLLSHGVSHWLLQPTPPPAQPLRLRSLCPESGEIVFRGPEGEAVLRRGDTVVASLAELSGALRERNLRRVLAQNAYRGRAAATGLDDDLRLRSVLANRPLLDLYLLSPEHELRGWVRIVPGKFDHRGLGERATISTSGNLEALLHLAQEYAGRWELHTDFGLADLPGCRLRQPAQGEEALQANLAAAARYGWLMVDLARQEARRPQADPLPPLVQTVATLLGDNPTAAPAADTRPAPTTDLPPPPALKASPSPLLSRLNRGTAAAAGVAGLLWLLRHGPAGLWPGVWHYGFGLGLLPAAAALLLAWRGLRNLLLKRQIEDLPVSRARSVALGLVEVSGRATRRYALVAPWSQTPCVYYRLRKYRRDGRGNWRLYSDRDSGPIPFYLEDATGRVAVDPQGARILAGFQGEGSGPSLLPQLAQDDEKWVEQVIPEGVVLYVLGLAREETRQRPSLRQQTSEALRRLKGDPAAMGQLDTDGDGRISPQEWDAGRALTEQQLLRESLSAPPTPPTSKVTAVIGRPRHRSLPFVIAESASELALTRRLGWLVLAQLGAATGAALWGGLRLFGAIYRP